MTPTYLVWIHRDDELWAAEVTGSLHGADPLPVGHATDAETVDEAERAVRDLIATLLECDEGDFDINVAPIVDYSEQK